MWVGEGGGKGEGGKKWDLYFCLLNRGPSLIMGSAFTGLNVDGQPRSCVNFVWQ